MWLLWCILPRWLSSSIFGIYAVSYIVHRPQDTGRKKSSTATSKTLTDDRRLAHDEGNAS